MTNNYLFYIRILNFHIIACHYEHDRERVIMVLTPFTMRKNSSSIYHKRQKHDHTLQAVREA